MRASSHAIKGRKEGSPENVTPLLALKNLEAFTRKLEANWERDGLEWALGLLVLLRAFIAEAKKDSPDGKQLSLIQTAIRDYLAKYKFLKGIDFVLIWADVVIAANRSNPQAS